MFVHDHIVEGVIDYCNKVIKDSAIQIATNCNPENDEIKYSYNTVMRFRITDARNLKNELLREIKEQVIKWKRAWVKDAELQKLWDQIAKLVKSKADILWGWEINVKKDEVSTLKALINKITWNK